MENAFQFTFCTRFLSFSTSSANSKEKSSTLCFTFDTYLITLRSSSRRLLAFQKECAIKGICELKGEKRVNFLPTTTTDSIRQIYMTNKVLLNSIMYAHNQLSQDLEQHFLLTHVVESEGDGSDFLCFIVQYFFYHFAQVFFLLSFAFFFAFPIVKWCENCVSNSQANKILHRLSLRRSMNAMRRKKKVAFSSDLNFQR
jgi:hypothetical protein